MITYKKIKLNKYDVIHVENSNGFLVTLCSFGASIYQANIGNDYLLSTLSDFNSFLTSSAYLGKTLGRVSGRIKNGEIVLGNKTYKVSVNEGNNCLHGGNGSLSYKNFKTDIYELDNSLTVSFSYVSKNKDAGFPGKVKVVIDYTFSDDYSILINYKALAFSDTVLNLSSHPYFTLADEDVYKIKAQIPAVSVFESDKELIRLKEIPLDEVTDFSNLKELGKHIFDPCLNDVKLNGYDHLYHLKNGHVKFVGSKYQLDCDSDYNGVILYTTGFGGGESLADGTTQKVHRAFTAEFCDIQPIFLKAKESYNHFAKYTFSKLK